MMKKILPIFLSCGLVISSTFAATNSRHTFLMPRAHGVNLPMEMSLYHDLIFNYENKNQSNLQITPFFQATNSGSDIGEYFGIGNGKNTIKISDTATGDGLPPFDEIFNRYLIHKQDDASELAGTVRLTPKQRSGGLRLDFLQYLKFPFKNTFFKISAPIVYVENDLNFNVLDSHTDANNNTLLNFFRGDAITQPNDANKQSALTNAKLNTGRQCTFGVADIDLAYGYKLIEDKNKHLFFNIAATIPTGSRVRSEYLFKPIYGNGHHFAAGCGIDASIKLWNNKKHCGKLIFALNYRYLFEGTEKRTIPLKSNSFKWAHYYLAGEIGKTQNLVPAANLLTQDVSVRPGNQFDAMLLFAFKSKKFLLDLGYNLFNKETESVSLKNEWIDNKYGLASQDTNVTNQFDIANSLLTINNSTLDISRASTPSQLTNKVFAALGYKFSVMKYPSNFGIGGSYEFASSNHEFENYAIWTKLGISF
ncbi:hypothetical protein ACFLYH_01660 [Candidatus Dependentiae bacterium]